MGGKTWGVGGDVNKARREMEESSENKIEIKVASEELRRKLNIEIGFGHGRVVSSHGKMASGFKT